MLDNLLQVLSAGLGNGAMYALVALGFGLVYSVSRYLNLLQGEFVVLGGLITVWLSEVHHWHVALAAIAAVAATCVVGLVFQRLTLSPSRRLAPDVALMVTFGGVYVVRGIAMVLFGKDPVSLPSFSGEAPIMMGNVAVSTQTLWVIATLAVTSIALWAFFNRTVTGKAMLACAENPNGAQLVGIDLGSVATRTFVLAAMIGAAAGVVAAPLTSVSYDAGLSAALHGFIAAIFGGLGSYPGAVVGGLVVGVVEAIATGYVSSEFKDAVTFGALLLLLLVRPHGIFGHAR
jgi:branched-chain amino acid transport system permease protein